MISPGSCEPFGKGRVQIELIQISSKDRAVLMCFEGDPAFCHRRVLTDMMQAMGYSVIEL